MGANQPRPRPLTQAQRRMLYDAARHGDPMRRVGGARGSGVAILASLRARNLVGPDNRATSDGVRELGPCTYCAGGPRPGITPRVPRLAAGGRRCEWCHGTGWEAGLRP